MATLQAQLAEAQEKAQSARAAVISAEEQGRASLEELAKKHEEQLSGVQGAAAEAVEELGRLREEAEGLRSEAAGAEGRHKDELGEAEEKLAEAQAQVCAMCSVSVSVRARARVCVFLSWLRSR